MSKTLSLIILWLLARLRWLAVVSMLATMTLAPVLLESSGEGLTGMMPPAPSLSLPSSTLALVVGLGVAVLFGRRLL